MCVRGSKEQAGAMLGTMSLPLLSVFVVLLVVDLGHAIDCYQCSSNSGVGCSEMFDEDDTTLAPTSCESVFEARYCIKTTGIYEGEIGTKRFCSARDHGDYCEYIERKGDDRAYRSCIYTCSRDGCNGAWASIRLTMKEPLPVLLLLLSASYAKLLFNS